MSIFDETDQRESITGSGRSLQLFTNRLKSQRLFLSYLNGESPPKKIIFFYGDGGYGKSLLLRYLSKYCCKRLTTENWQYVQVKNDREFAEEIKAAQEGFEIVPYAILDFGEQPRGDDIPQQAFSALIMMQRQLARHGFHFPLFTFACVWHLHKTNKLASTNLKSLFPSEEMDLVAALIDSFGGTTAGALAKTAIGLISKHLKEKFEIFRAKRSLDEEEILEIQGMDPEKELVGSLPRFFAEDLNAGMSGAGSHKRVVLFFDTHEALIGSERRLSDHAKFERDRWLRLLLGSLNLGGGIVPLMAGRERPLHWSKATEFKIPENFLDAHLIGYITKEDATEYLRKAGVTGAKLQAGLVEYSQAQENEIHPYLLGLCADVVLTAKHNNEGFDVKAFTEMEAVADKAKAVTDRFISYAGEMGYAVKSLCAARSFDTDIFKALGLQLNFHTTEPDFSVLVGFSFVWSGNKDGRYRIHDLMRRLMRDMEDEVTQKAHKVLEKHHRDKYTESSDDAALAEAIYHANQVDWVRGVEEWKKVFDEALQKSKYALCKLLLDVRGVLVIKDNFRFAYVSESEGNFFSEFSLYEPAMREYEESIAAYDRVIEIKPDSASAHGRKASVQRNLGDLLATLSKHDEAEQSYKDSIRALDTALTLSPDLAASHANKGHALRSLGDLQATLTKHDEAMESYQEAIKSFDVLLKLKPDELISHNSKASALLKLGDLQVNQSKYDEALTSFENSIRALDTALALTPDSAVTHGNKGYALDHLGSLQMRLSKYDEAMTSLKDAVKAYDAALNQAPDAINIHNNKGSVLESLGELQLYLFKPDEAMLSLKDAVKAYDIALGLAPDHIYAHNNKGNALRHLGNVQRGQSKYDDAEQSYRNAIKVADCALKLAPDYINAHNNKGKGLAGLGDIQSKQSKPDEAVISLGDAIEAFDAALKLAPHNISAQNNKGVTLRLLGDLQVRRSKYEEAVRSYEEAIGVCDAALCLAPDYISAYNNKGNVLRSLGILQANQSKRIEAVNSFSHAIQAYDRALKIAPQDTHGHVAKGLVLALLGFLRVDLSQAEEALKDLEAAIEAFSVLPESTLVTTGIRQSLEKIEKAIEKLRQHLSSGSTVKLTAESLALSLGEDDLPKDPTV
jgi:tetratricopeptide (TPR) repeat protein